MDRLPRAVSAAGTLPLLANVWGVVLLVGVPDYAKAIGLVGLTIHWVEMVVAWYALATLQEKGLIKGRAVFMHLVAALAFGYPGLAGALRRVTLHRAVLGEDRACPSGGFRDSVVARDPMSSQSVVRRARHDIQVAAGLEPVPLLSFLPGYIIRRKQEEGPTKKPVRKRPVLAVDG